MDNLSNEARQSLPKKPLNAYFKFRSAKIQEFKDCEDKGKRVKQAWQDLDKCARDKLDEQYQIELKEYKTKLEEWKAKFGISAEDLKQRKPGSKQVNVLKQEEQGLSLAQTQKWQSFKQAGSSFMTKLTKQFEQKLKQFHHSQMRQKLNKSNKHLSHKYRSAFEQICYHLKDRINSIIDETLKPHDSEDSQSA